MENWRAVPGWEGLYEASDLGRVRSLDRTIRVKDPWGRLRHRHFRGRVLKLSPGTNGYPVAQFTAPGRRKYYNVHALIALVFIGPPPPGQEVRHKDGVRSHCALANLHYGTRSQNAMDRHEHGTMRPLLGEKCASAKLNAADVRTIRSSKLSQRKLGARFGVSHKTIGAVQRGDSWSHV